MVGGISEVDIDQIMRLRRIDVVMRMISEYLIDFGMKIVPSFFIEIAIVQKVELIFYYFRLTVLCTPGTYSFHSRYFKSSANFNL